MKSEELLVKALKFYSRKWMEDRRNSTSDIDIAQKEGMIYLSQWIISSIEGDICTPHKTNICNVVINNAEYTN